MTPAELTRQTNIMDAALNLNQRTRRTIKLCLAGINIQYPWTDHILEHRKTIETRTYPLPKKHKGKNMWIIETPGSLKTFKARVVGVVNFGYSEEYLTMSEWGWDIERHCCGIHSGYHWDGVSKKFRWLITMARRIERPFLAADMSRGIVYSSPHEAWVELL